MTDFEARRRPLSRCVRSMTRSRLRALTARVHALDGINMGQGNNLLPTPPVLIDAAHAAMCDGYNDYSVQEGRPELRNLIHTSLLAPRGIVSDPELELRVTSGATGGFFAAARSLLDPGTEAIVLEPYYPYHDACLKLTGADIRYVRLAAPHWDLDMEAIRAAVNPATRAIVLCNPCNPTGRVYRREELVELVALCVEHNIVILCDEVYEMLTYGSYEHTPVWSLSEARNCSIVLSSFSKSYAITGWRIGYAYGPADLMARFTLVHDAVYVCAPTPMQRALAMVLPKHDEIVADIHAEFAWRKSTTVEALTLGGFEPLDVHSTYYVMASYGPLYGDIPAIEACERLLDSVGIASVPASAFYHDGHDPHLLRFCFALPDQDLRRAAQLLAGLQA